MKPDLTSQQNDLGSRNTGYENQRLRFFGALSFLGLAPLEPVSADSADEHYRDDDNGDDDSEHCVLA